MRTLQATLSGKDSGGYAFQNVMHFTTTNDTDDEHTILNALNQELVDNLLPSFTAAMSDSTYLLNIGSRLVGNGVSGYTLNHPLNIPGDRDLQQYPAPVSGKLAFYPKTGGNVGHIYLAGACDGDYIGDAIQSTYQGLLEDIITALETYDGTDATFGWQLVVYNRKLFAGIAVASVVALLTACYLSKRARP
jgi:hypothetical protein